jgi:hypothetical protein
MAAKPASPRPKRSRGRFPIKEAFLFEIMRPRMAAEMMERKKTTSKRGISMSENFTKAPIMAKKREELSMQRMPF